MNSEDSDSWSGCKGTIKGMVVFFGLVDGEQRCELGGDMEGYISPLSEDLM